VQLKEEHDLLQERVVNGERDLEQLKLENQALTDKTGCYTAVRWSLSVSS
jgi:SH3 domain protein